MSACNMNWIKPSFCEDGTSGPTPAKTSKIANSSDTEAGSVVRDAQSALTWTETHKPKCIQELVVNGKKMKELKEWLTKSVDSNSTSKLLLMIGPPGCGKTMALQFVCKNLNLRIKEWINPLDRKALDFECYTNAPDMFEETIFRAARYKSCLVSNPQKHIVLVKDFPNVLFQSPSKLHDIVENLFGKLKFPVVFVCNKSKNSDIFSSSMKRRIHIIGFNPIPKKSVYKVLKNIILKSPNPNILKEKIPDRILLDISESCQGDLRRAISELQFRSIETSKSAKHKIQFLPNNLSSCTLVSKDNRIDFFHGIGRVLYPKRIESADGLQFVHSAESVVENFQSEAGGFLSQLHENYPGRMGDLAALAEAAGRLATCDLLRSRWQERDVFSHYSLAVAVRGLMVANRVPRKTEFQAFRKSHTSRMEVDNKAIELEGKMLFCDLECTKYDYLVEMLPYSELLLQNMTKEQLEYVRKTCVFNSDGSA